MVADFESSNPDQFIWTCRGFRIGLLSRARLDNSCLYFTRFANRQIEYIYEANIYIMETPSKPHIGRKISRIRELRGMKQEALAQVLGVSQQTVSNFENSEEVEESRLGEIATALGVTLEGLKHFTEESVFNNINNFHDNAIQNNFNPIEKVIELYERLLQAEKDKFDYFEKLINKK